MLDRKIEILKLPIPVTLNNNILNYLQKQGKWDFVYDRDRQISPNMKQVASPGLFTDAGLARITYSNGLSGTVNDNYLNNFGDLIYFHCKEKSKKFKIEQITRFYWNLYSRSSKCLWHTDEKGIDEFVSIIYNLHDNDGGTEFESGFIKSKEGEAIIFPSNLPHKGVGPKEYKWRLNLNIVAHQKLKYA
tara:strand:+ start:1770 stop:2336 length:567 start_codon:yes stop_codon:yes gene_type:complete